MREKLKAILGKHKVIGDTTYGLGYAEAEQLTTDIISAFVEVISTHSEHEGNYCDTGEDMEWACRSNCTELAIKRLWESEEEKPKNELYKCQSYIRDSVVLDCTCGKCF